MTRRLTAVVADVLGVAESTISDASEPTTVPEWTSLAHIHLVLELEAEYATTFSPEDAMDMLSVGLIRTILTERGVAVE